MNYIIDICFSCCISCWKVCLFDDTSCLCVITNIFSWICIQQKYSDNSPFLSCWCTFIIWSGLWRGLVPMIAQQLSSVGIWSHTHKSTLRHHHELTQFISFMYIFSSRSLSSSKTLHYKLFTNYHQLRYDLTWNPFRHHHELAQFLGCLMKLQIMLCVHIWPYQWGYLPVIFNTHPPNHFLK